MIDLTHSKSAYRLHLQTRNLKAALEEELSDTLRLNRRAFEEMMRVRAQPMAIKSVSKTFFTRRPGLERAAAVRRQDRERHALFAVGHLFTLP